MVRSPEEFNRLYDAAASGRARRFSGCQTPRGIGCRVARNCAAQRAQVKVSAWRRQSAGSRPVAARQAARRSSSSAPTFGSVTTSSGPRHRIARDRHARGQRLDHDQAERVGAAGEDEAVGLGIAQRQLVGVDRAEEAGVLVAALELLELRWGRSHTFRYGLALLFGGLPRTAGYRVVTGRSVKMSALNDAGESRDQPVQIDGDNALTLPVSIGLAAGAVRRLRPA